MFEFERDVSLSKMIRPLLYILIVVNQVPSLARRWQ